MRLSAGMPQLALTAARLRASLWLVPASAQIASDDVGSLIRMAKCAERTGQFKDMLDCMHKASWRHRKCH